MNETIDIKQYSVGQGNTKDARWTKTVTHVVDDFTGWEDKEVSYETDDGFRVVNIIDGQNRWLVFSPAGYPRHGFPGSVAKNLDRAYEIIERFRSEK